tara:strand:+ start:285 stop:431 length:147 start_codon:yes stop_codon:yes gene_type:complete
MNICLNCYHQTDYTLKCAKCFKVGQLVDIADLDKSKDPALVNLAKYYN